MKTLKLKSVLAYALIISTGIGPLLSCYQQNSTLDKESRTIKATNLVSFQHNDLGAINFKNITARNDSSLNSIWADISADNINNITKQFKEVFAGDFTNGTISPSTLIIYTSGSNADIVLKEVKGFSILNSDSNGPYHKLYTIDDKGIAVEDKRYSAYYLKSGFIMKTADIIGMAVFGQNVSYTFLSSQGRKAISDLNANISELHPSLEIQAMKFGKTYFNLKTDPCSDCGGGGTEDAYCVDYDDNSGAPPTKICKSPTCVIQETNNQIKSIYKTKIKTSPTLGEEKNLKLLDVDLGRNFRDRFLANGCILICRLN